jgi:hypothetical protein
MLLPFNYYPSVSHTANTNGVCFKSEYSAGNLSAVNKYNVAFQFIVSGSVDDIMAGRDQHSLSESEVGNVEMWLGW